MWRIQLVSGFQLGQMCATISKSLIQKSEPTTQFVDRTAVTVLLAAFRGSSSCAAAEEVSDSGATVVFSFDPCRTAQRFTKSLSPSSHSSVHALRCRMHTVRQDGVC
jgi:hypothetical protein